MADRLVRLVLRDRSEGVTFLLGDWGATPIADVMMELRAGHHRYLLCVGGSKVELAESRTAAGTVLIAVDPENGVNFLDAMPIHAHALH